MDNKKICKSCGSIEIKEIYENCGIHYGKYVCCDCDTFVNWIPKPQNENKQRRNKNQSFRKKHMELNNGKLICNFCGVDNAVYNKYDYEFQLDHIKPLAKGGLDEFENTQILCMYCHDEKTKKTRMFDKLRRIINGEKYSESEFDKILGGE